MRAVLEGVAYNSRWLHEAVERFVKRRLDPVRVIGGGATSDLWCQIHADVMGRTIERVAEPLHANLRGRGDVRRPSPWVRSTSRRSTGSSPSTPASSPMPTRTAAYDRLYGEFPKLYRSQKPMFARLNRTGRSTPPSRPY